MFLQSLPDHDVLGQAFEDALEVLQQHSGREMQCPPGNKHPPSTSSPSSFFTGKHLLKYTGGGVISQKWINGMFFEDEKEENYLEGFYPSMSTAQGGEYLPGHSTGKLLDWPHLPSSQQQPRCIELTFPIIEDI